MNIECIRCGEENAYHNGVSFECPDCGAEWEDGLDLFENEEDQNKELDEEDFLICSECGHTYNKNYNSVSKSIAGVDKEIYTCPACGYTFGEKNDFTIRE